jgi:hypothetical protein
MTRGRDDQGMKWPGTKWPGDEMTGTKWPGTKWKGTNRRVTPRNCISREFQTYFNVVARGQKDGTLITHSKTMLQTSTILYFSKIFEYMHCWEIAFHGNNFHLFSGHSQKRLISKNTKEEKRGERGSRTTSHPTSWLQLTGWLQMPTFSLFSTNRRALRTPRYPKNKREEKLKNYDNQNLPSVCRQMQ